ncbi:MAG: hypothetical protein GXY44_10870 [Phycisphaerales bacterium]|nr:hypothetical protein [Phycisphaerales bacterium]
MRQLDLDTLARELARLMGDLLSLHGELAMHLRNKLSGARQADSAKIQSINAREKLLVERLTEREGLRRQLCRHIAGQLGWSEERQEKIKLDELAAGLPEPHRSQLLTVAVGLRKTVREIERMRVTMTLVTQVMLEHLGHVLAVMTTGVPSGEGYLRNGRRQGTNSSCVFEAVG